MRHYQKFEALVAGFKEAEDLLIQAVENEGMLAPQLGNAPKNAPDDGKAFDPNKHSGGAGKDPNNSTPPPPEAKSNLPLIALVAGAALLLLGGSS